MINIRLVQTQDRNVNQLQSNVKQTVEAAFSEYTGMFTAVFSGFAVTQSANMFWQTGTTQNAVTLMFPNLLATSNSASMTITGLPTNLWPDQEQFVLARVVDSNIDSVGLAIIETDGTINFTKDVASSGFTNSGIKGTKTFSAAYVRKT